MPAKRTVRQAIAVGAIVAVIAATLLIVSQSALGTAPVPGPWERKKLMEIPAYSYAPDYDAAGGVKAIFYEGLPYEGKPTKVFAYVGMPDLHPGEDGVPAVVLVHGGAGTAYADWVKKWNDRGYAAIAMDLEGHLPLWDEQTRSYKPHEGGGPNNQPVWQDIGKPEKEQWTYHAVADTALAHSLLRSLPGVDPGRVGIVGVSWGAVLTEIAVGIDDRFRFAVVVYGSGFVAESESYFGDAYRSWPREMQERFERLWEPAAYLRRAKLPMLWVNGDNDGHFPLTVFTKSYEVAKPDSVLSIHPGMPHNQEEAVRPPEIYAFADSIVSGSAPLARIVRHERDADVRRVTVAMELDSPEPIVRAEFYYTLNVSDRLSPVWNKIVVDLPAYAGLRPRIEAELPAQAKAYYGNAIDARGYIVSTGLTDVAGRSP
ncbi:S9 family peptidase [Cohnella sp. REN36]|uniref:alpha/beta hydrolase family protein n=1 Tax=Cohnella sp. REN36 TaxID=2887347 RepID=UPI001D14AF36|nr:prolyl oligopeptidase family serine peptidase [Cohnella sp. REN36]MCC3375280.1 prolyl oligopeptidase family serine peptidase [Cohnella sp. REN36]